MPEIYDYDGLAPSNSAAPPNGFPDGALGKQYPSIIRELMARTRRWHDDICGRLKATGTNGNYVVATSRGLDLALGASIRFRANHENPNAGPTLLGRPLTYADGSTIPAGAIKVNQLCDASFDNDNNRWTLSLMPAASASAGTITGDKISLSGEAQGSVAIRSGTAWIASAAGTATQFFRGGPNPGFAAIPTPVLLACTLSANTTIANRTGLPHTATLSRLAKGSYRLTVNPALPTGAVVLCTASSVFRQAAAAVADNTTINVKCARTVDPTQDEDIDTYSVSVVVF